MRIYIEVPEYIEPSEAQRLAVAVTDLTGYMAKVVEDA